MVHFFLALTSKLFLGFLWIFLLENIKFHSFSLDHFFPKPYRYTPKWPPNYESSFFCCICIGCFSYSGKMSWLTLQYHEKLWLGIKKNFNILSWTFILFITVLSQNGYKRKMIHIGEFLCTFLTYLALAAKWIEFDKR